MERRERERFCWGTQGSHTHTYTQAIATLVRERDRLAALCGNSNEQRNTIWHLGVQWKFIAFPSPRFYWPKIIEQIVVAQCRTRNRSRLRAAKIKREENNRF